MIEHSRNTWLDLLRAIAILLVLASHGRVFLVDTLPITVNFRLGGYWGVELFFVLSGFLIGRILYESFFDSPKWVLNFIVRRWFRTVPNYFLFLLVKVAVLGFGVGATYSSLFPYLTFTQNLAWRHPDFFPEAWSLSVEEVFYFLVPIALLGSWRVLARFGVSFEKVVITVIVFFSLFSIVLRFYYANSPDILWDADIRKIVIFRFDALMFGFLSFILYKRYALPARGLYAFGGGLLLISAIIVLGPLENLDKSYFAKTLLFSFTTLGFCMILLGGMYSKFRIHNNHIATLISKISMYSYSMYLSHLSLLELVKLNFSNSIYGFFIWLTLTFIISAFVYEYFEKIILNYRDKKFPSLNGLKE